MDLRTWIRVLARRFWLLLLGTVLAMVGSYLAFRLLTPWPRYQATTVVIINDKGLKADWNSLQANKNLAMTYAQWALRRPVLEGVIETLDIPLSVAQLREQIKIRSVEDTQLVELSATSNDPQLAAAIANELVRQLEAQIEAASASGGGTQVPTEEELAQWETRIALAQAELINLSDRLAEYQPASPPAAEVAQLEKRISDAEAELLTLSAELSDYQPSSAKTEEIAQLETRIAEADTELVDLTARLLKTDSTVEAELLTRRINVLQSNLAMWRGELEKLYARDQAQSEAEVSQLLRRIEVLKGNLEIWHKELDRLYLQAQSTSEAEVNQLIRRISVVQANLRIWQEEYNKLKAEYESFQAPSLVVVEAAHPPANAASPLINILIAGVVGFLLSAGLVILFEYGNIHPN